MTEPTQQLGSPPPRPPLLSPAMWAVIVSVVAFVAAWPAMTIAPNEYDSCVFVWMGKRMLVGDLPYRDLWDNKFPVLYWLNALAAAAGAAGAAIYAMQSLAIAAGGCLLYGIGRRALGEWPGRLAGLAYVTFAAVPATLMTGNLTEDWAAPFAVLCVYAMARYADEGRRSLLWPLLSGLGLGVAVSLRPPAGLIGLALLPLLGALWRRRRIRFLSVPAWLLGFALLPGAMAIWARHAGVWDLMIDQCIKFNIAYGTAAARPSWATWGEVGRRWWNIVDATWPWHLAAGLGLAALFVPRSSYPSPFQGAGLRSPLGPGEGQTDREHLTPSSGHTLTPTLSLRGRGGIPAPHFRGAEITPQPLILVWLAAAIASALPSLRFYNHHYYLALAPLSLLIGALFQPLLAAAARRSVFRQAAGWLLAAALFAAVGVHLDRRVADCLAQERRTQPIREVGDYLERQGTPGDSVYVFGWGVESDLLARLGWRCPTRHVMVIFYPELHSRDELLRQWRDDLLANPPDWIVCRKDRDLVRGRWPTDYGWDDPHVRMIAEQVHQAYEGLYEPIGLARPAGTTEPAEPFGQWIVYRRRAGWLLAGEWKTGWKRDWLIFRGRLRKMCLSPFPRPVAETKE